MPFFVLPQAFATELCLRHLRLRALTMKKIPIWLMFSAK
ncbi:hypothetical protein Agau_P100157 (plasmid) [Agrobacterium tumefaciens F2]|nr:hypothetical protein Agau_P100157 [Agrobacterium tumefaciens F2]